MPYPAIGDPYANTRGGSYTDAQAVDALEAVVAGSVLGEDNVLFIDLTDGIMKQDLASNLPSGGGGEINTASNINVAGIGVWKQKATFDLQFRGLLSTSALLTLALDDVNHEIEFTIVESAFDLGNFGTRTHASLSDSPPSAHHVKYALLDDLIANEITAIQAIDANLISSTEWAIVAGLVALGSGSIITVGERTGLHTKYLDSEAVDAVEAVGLGTAISTDHMVFSNAGVLERQVLSGLTHAILTGLGGRYVDSEAVDALEAVATTANDGADSFIFVDATDGVMKKDLISNLPAGGYSDAQAVDAIEAVANAPVALADSLIFVDVTDGILKQDLLSDLEALFDLGNFAVRTHASLSDAPVSAHHVKYVLTDDLTSGEITQLQNINTEAISNAEWAILAGLVGLGSGSIITAGERTGLHTTHDIVDDTTPQLGGDLDLNAFGITEELVAGEALVNGNLCYMGASGEMFLADADAEATADTLLAMCTETISASSTGTFLLFGRYTTTGLTASLEYFISTTAGGITSTRPSATGDIVRHVGSAISTTVLFFNPSGVYVEIT